MQTKRLINIEEESLAIIQGSRVTRQISIITVKGKLTELSVSINEIKKNIRFSLFAIKKHSIQAILVFYKIISNFAEN